MDECRNADTSGSEQDHPEDVDGNGDDLRTQQHKQKQVALPISRTDPGLNQFVAEESGADEEPHGQ